MNKKINMCKKCRQEILQANPTKCPYCGSEELVSEEESKATEELKMGKVNAISFLCPYCGGKQLVNSKAHEVECLKCGKKYLVPEKARELL